MPIFSRQSRQRKPKQASFVQGLSAASGAAGEIPRCEIPMMTRTFSRIGTLLAATALLGLVAPVASALPPPGTQTHTASFSVRDGLLEIVGLPPELDCDVSASTTTPLYSDNDVEIATGSVSVSCAPRAAPAPGASPPGIVVPTVTATVCIEADTTATASTTGSATATITSTSSCTRAPSASCTANAVNFASIGCSATSLGVGMLPGTCGAAWAWTKPVGSSWSVAWTCSWKTLAVSV